MEDEDMHDQSEPQNNASQEKKKKPRGPSKGLKSMPGVPRVLDWDEFNRPVGKWSKAYKVHVGEISRAKVSILFKDWDEVPKGIKDTLWEDVKVIIIVWCYNFNLH